MHSVIAQEKLQFSQKNFETKRGIPFSSNHPPKIPEQIVPLLFLYL